MTILKDEDDQKGLIAGLKLIADVLGIPDDEIAEASKTIGVTADLSNSAGDTGNRWIKSSVGTFAA